MKIVLIILSIFTFSCRGPQHPEIVITRMKSPVIVIGISNTMVSPCITVKDSLGEIYSTEGSVVAYSIARSRKVGDTIK